MYLCFTKDNLNELLTLFITTWWYFYLDNKQYFYPLYFLCRINSLCSLFTATIMVSKTNKASIRFHHLELHNIYYTKSSLTRGLAQICLQTLATSKPRLLHTSVRVLAQRERISRDRKRVRGVKQRLLYSA